MPFNPRTLRDDWNFPTTIYFGPGRITELAAACRSVGVRRPLLVTDAVLAALPIVKDAVAQNMESGLPTVIFSEVQPNPVESNVAAGVEAYRAGEHDGIIAMGGGSAMDTGKVIALMAGLDASLFEYAGKWRQIPPEIIAPVVAVPTTAGTGSEVGRAAVITRASTNTKTIIIHPGMMPSAVIADPALTLGLPPHLTAGTGMDALAHSLEALSTPYYHPMADGIAMEGMRLVREWLPEAVLSGGNLTARAHMLAAAMMGATAFQKGLGAIHALSHPVGAVYGIHHGLTNAVFMPYVLAFNRPALGDKMERLARYLGLAGTGFDAILQWLLDLRSTLGIPHTLRDLGVPDDNFDTLAAMAAVDPCARDNPVPLGEDTLRQLLQETYDGRLDVS